MLALMAGAAAFAVYLATIYPGLMPIGDAAKFSFVGRVLGTPHPPGYPLWVMVSHVFGYVPWGTLAYRMNVLSALFAAGAVVATFAIARRLGAGRVAAAAAAVSLGFGQSFWATALYPKGYTLNAFLVGIGTLLLLRWSESRQRSDFLWAVAVFALGVGNHLTIIALVPALVAFAVFTDRRTVLKPGMLAASAALVLAGLAQYLFILIRTLQGAPFLEARARTLGELWAVMTARRWAHEIGAYSPSAVVTDRLPVVFDLVRTELGPLGLVLAGVGLGVLALRQPRRALLFGGGALGVVLLTASMSSQEDRGFLLSAFVLLWAMASAGMQWLVDAGRKRGRVWSAVAVAAVAIVLPVVQLRDNYTRNDHHADWFETVYYDALFADLPARTAFVRDDYHYDMMLVYKLLGEDAARGREVHLVPASDRASVEALRGQGYEVLAFRAGRDRLAEFGFSFAPYEPSDPERARVLRLREVFRVEAVPACREIGNTGWRDVSEVAQPKGRLSIRIDNYRAFDAGVTFYAAADRPLQPALVGSRGQGVPSMTVDTFVRDDADARIRLRRQAANDGVQLSAAMTDAPYVVRAAARVNDGGEQAVFGLDLGPGVSRLMASAVVDQDTPHRAALCTHALAGTQGWSADARPLKILPDSHGVQFEHGWHAIERRDDRPAWRWTTDRAALVVPIDQARDTTVIVHGEPFGGSKAVTLRLLANGRPLEAAAGVSASTGYVWSLPASAMRPGLNELVLEVNGAATPASLTGGNDHRLLGMQVTSIELTADARPAEGKR